MNYMKEFARMLGVELGEEFKLKDFDEIYRLTEESVEFRTGEYWLYADNCVITDIVFGHVEIAKIPKPILDKKEKEYLSAVIKVAKPIRGEIESITKKHTSEHCFYGDIHGECLSFKLKSKYQDYIQFPVFQKGKMYKGMELDRAYTLEELGL